MLLVPSPGCRNYLFELAMLRIPAQLAHNFHRGSHQLRWVARTAWFLHRRNSPAAHCFTGLDHLSNRVAIPIAQIVKSPGARSHGQDMSLGQINDMNVVPDACSVGG